MRTYRQTHSRVATFRHAAILEAFCFWVGEAADEAYYSLLAGGHTILRVI